MSKNLRVILLEDIPDVGAAGEIVNVTEGFARNALFPSGKAAIASEKHVARANEKKQTAAAQKAAELAIIQKQAEAIDGTELTIEARVKDEDTIFGAVTAATVAEELEKANVVVKASNIDMPSKKITTLGTYEIVVSFGNEVEAKLQLNIVPEETK
jgi:large subunit ribosomal protein L9